MTQEKKQKIKKIIQVIYNVISGLFIAFITLSLVLGGCSNKNEGKQENAPTTAQKAKRNLYINGTTAYISGSLVGNKAKEIYDDNVVNGSFTDGTRKGISYSTFTSASTIYLINGFGTGTYSLNYAKFTKYTMNNNSNIGSPSGYCYSIMLSNQNNDNNTLYIEMRGYYDTSNKLTGTNCFGVYNNSQYTDGLNLRSTTSDTKFMALANSLEGSSITENDLSSAYDAGASSGYNAGYSAGYDIGASSAYQAGYQAGIQETYETNSELIITADYDFRGLISSEIDYNTGLMRVAGSSGGLTTISTLALNGLTFSVEGNSYNQVYIQYISLDENNGLYDSIADEYTTAGGYFGDDYVYYRGLQKVEYRYLDTNSNVIRSVEVVKGYSYEYKNDNSEVIKGFNYFDNKWTSSVFRVITIENDTGAKQSTPAFSTTFSTAQLLSLNGSQLVNNNGSMGNAFSLLTEGFSSVASILGIVVVPGITIGLLLFIPLIVAVILFVIKMIKK